MRMFRKKPKPWLPPSVKVKYPKWTFCRVVGTDKYYLLLDKARLEFISDRAFWSWGRQPLSVSKESVSGYKPWKKIGFAPGAVIESEVDGSRYFMSGDDVLSAERRLIATPDFWTVLGFNPRLAFVVSLTEVDFHARGADIIDVRNL